MVVGIAGAWLAMAVFGGQTTRMGPFEVDLSSQLGSGRTVLALPPLGEMRADTHDAPLTVKATLVDVDVEKLTDDLKEKSTGAIVDDIEADARANLSSFALRILGVAVGGAIIIALGIFRLRWRSVAAAGATALLLVGGSEALAWRTFRQEAFAEPTFAGTLRLAPQLLGPAQEVAERIDDFRANLERIVGGAARAYAALDLQTIGGDELRVLHVSDVHLNTLGLDFAVQIARGFDVDLVLDTGDLTSYGTPLEEAIVSQIPRFRRPYVFVRGNHDPPSLVDRIDATRNASVLENEAEQIGDLTIYGAPHPVFTEDQQADVETAEFQQRARDAGPSLLRDIERLDEPPDVVAVHDDRMAEALAGHGRAVWSGHYHRARAVSVEDRGFLRAGSTGGAGVNMFEGRAPVPLSATILYFERGRTPELIAYDVVEQSPTTGRLTIQRHLVSDAPEGAASPSPSPAPVSPEP